MGTARARTVDRDHRSTGAAAEQASPAAGQEELGGGHGNQAAQEALRSQAPAEPDEMGLLLGSLSSSGARAGRERVSVSDEGVRRDSVDVGLSGGGPSLGLRHSEEVEQDGVRQQSQVGANLSGSGLTLDASSSERRADPEGGSVSSSSSGSVSFGEGGATGRYTHTPEAREIAGSSESEDLVESRATSVGGTVDLQGRASLEVNHQVNDPDGRSLRGATGTGHVDIDNNGGVLRLAEWGGDGRVSSGRAVAEGSFRSLNDVDYRQLPDGRYEVRLRQGLRGSLGGGGQTSGGRVRGTVGITSEQRDEEVRIVDSMDEVRALSRDPGTVELPASAEDAQALESGESISSSDTNGGTAGLTGNLGIVEVGGSVQLQTGERVAVSRRSGQVVRVELEESATMGATGTLGASGLARAQAGVTSRDRDRRAVDFDLSDPTQREQYEAFMRLRQWPPQGGRVVRDTHTEEVQTSHGGGLLGASVNLTNTVSETDGTVDGHEQHEVSGQEGSAVRVPGLGQYQESAGLTAVQRDGQTVYLVSGQVSADSEHGEDVRQGLTDLTGSQRDLPTDEEARASGRWSVTYRVPEAQMQAFVDRVVSGRMRPGALILEAAAGRQLRDELRATSDPTERNRALARFFASTGSNGLRWMRDAMDAPPDAEVSLNGDEHLSGDSRPAAAERRLEELEGRLEGAGGRQALQVLRDINALRGRMRARLTALRDSARYPDLPQEQREREIARTEEVLSRIGEVRQAARAAQQCEPRTQAEEELDELETPPEEAEPELDQEEEDFAADESATARANIRRYQQNLPGVRETATQTRATTRRSHSMHHSLSSAGTVPAQALGGAGLIFGLGAGSERDAYQSADNHYDEAEGLFTRANEARDTAAAAEAELESAGSPGPEQLLRMLNRVEMALANAVQAYRQANHHYQQAQEGYQGIQRRHSDQRRLWGR